MNFSIGKILSIAKNAIGAIVEGQWPTVDIYQREYSNPYSKTSVITITSATIRSYSIPDLDFYKDKLIIGMNTRAQNAADNRMSKNGRKLLNEAGMASAFLRLSQNNLTVQEDIPLEMLVNDSVVSGKAGTYHQLLIEQGFSPQSSNINFSIDPGALNVNRDVELVIFYVPLAATCYQ